VFAQDKSGHHGVLNSVMLKLLKIDENTKNPEGEDHTLPIY
jgi:predicted amidohydrolase YtcJ